MFFLLLLIPTLFSSFLHNVRQTSRFRAGNRLGFSVSYLSYCVFSYLCSYFSVSEVISCHPEGEGRVFFLCSTAASSFTKNLHVVLCDVK